MGGEILVWAQNNWLSRIHHNNYELWHLSLRVSIFIVHTMAYIQLTTSDAARWWPWTNMYKYWYHSIISFSEISKCTHMSHLSHSCRLCLLPSLRCSPFLVFLSFWHHSLFLYPLYFHISMSSNIGFHIFLILWPHIAHSSGNMLLKVLQCRRFQIWMNLNENLLP